MLTYSTKIHNLETLDLEIDRLQKRAKQLELKMDASLDYLQENYTSMVIDTFLPVIRQKTGLIGLIFQLFFQNQKLHQKFGMLTDFLFDKASEALDFVLDKLNSKKT